MTWIPLQHPPRELKDARLVIHHAAQLVAIGVSKPLLPSREDDSHTNLLWHGGDRWVGREIPGTAGLCVGLRPADLSLTVERNGEIQESLSLVGRTRDEGLEWIRATLESLGARVPPGSLDFHYEMPEHPVAEGRTFPADFETERAELAAWYENAMGLVVEMAERSADASPVVTWPHHFDVATLLSFGKTASGDDRTIGVGLSPGDDYIPEPYFYVTPWPHTKDGNMPPVEPGSWRTEDFFGATLTGNQLLAGGVEGQEERARSFLTAAVAGSLGLLKS